MLKREAKWFGERLAEFTEDQLYPMLNVGSHTSEFRTREQPWIDRYLFARARAKNLPVVHTDLRSAEGVDLVGDLTDPAFRQKLAEQQFRSVFCRNLMERVPNREEIAEAVVQAIVPGGHLFLSVPNVFPYHPDPIDTMYRPSVEEFAALYPGTTLVRGEHLACGTLVHYLGGKFLADPFSLIRNLYRRKKQVVTETQEGMSAGSWLPWLYRTFYQTCIVLRKNSPAASPS
jgi:SAM-dependent methyltransferase